MDPKEVLMLGRLLGREKGLLAFFGLGDEPNPVDVLNQIEEAKRHIQAASLPMPEKTRIDELTRAIEILSFAEKATKNPYLLPTLRRYLDMARKSRATVVKAPAQPLSIEAQEAVIDFHIQNFERLVVLWKKYGRTITSFADFKSLLPKIAEMTARRLMERGFTAGEARSSFGLTQEDIARVKKSHSFKKAQESLFRTGIKQKLSVLDKLRSEADMWYLEDLWGTIDRMITRLESEDPFRGSLMRASAMNRKMRSLG